jgi:hypothetical protein
MSLKKSLPLSYGLMFSPATDQMINIIYPYTYKLINIMETVAPE